MTRAAIYAVLGLALLLAAALGGYVLRDGAARSETAALQRTVETERAKAEKVPVAAAEKITALEGRVARLAGESKGLREQLAAARRAAPSARPVRVAQTSGEFVAAGPPRDETGGSCPDAGGTTPQSAGADGLRAAPDAAPAPSCLLAVGDRGEIRAAEADLVSDAGTHLVIGTGEVWRTQPGPPALIATAPLRGEVRVAPPPAPRPRWGFGARAEYRGGWAAGPAVAAPPLRVGRLQLEGVADVTAGAGELAAGATLIARW